MEILGYSLAILGKIMKTSLAALLYQSYERSWCTQLNVYLAGYYLTLKVWKSLRLHKALSHCPVLMLWWKLRYWGYHCPITDPSTHNNNNGTWFFSSPNWPVAIVQLCHLTCMFEPLLVVAWRLTWKRAACIIAGGGIRPSRMQLTHLSPFYQIECSLQSTVENIC